MTYWSLVDIQIGIDPFVRVPAIICFHFVYAFCLRFTTLYKVYFKLLCVLVCIFVMVTST